MPEARKTSPSLDYIIVGDNIDKTVSPHHITVDRQCQSLHNFHAYAVMDCTNFHGVANNEPMLSLLLSTFLPDRKDCNEVQHNYAILLGHELTQTVPYFKLFTDCIPKHIDRKYSKEMATKSTVVRYPVQL